MSEFQIFLFIICAFLFGYLLGFKWCQWQWTHCAKNNFLMRIDGKDLYLVEELKDK